MLNFNRGQLIYINPFSLATKHSGEIELVQWNRKELCSTSFSCLSLEQLWMYVDVFHMFWLGYWTQISQDSKSGPAYLNKVCFCVSDQFFCFFWFPLDWLPFMFVLSFDGASRCKRFLTFLDYFLERTGKYSSICFFHVIACTRRFCFSRYWGTWSELLHTHQVLQITKGKHLKVFYITITCYFVGVSDLFFILNHKTAPRLSIEKTLVWISKLCHCLECKAIDLKFEVKDLFQDFQSSSTKTKSWWFVYLRTLNTRHACYSQYFNGVYNERGKGRYVR